MGQQRLVPAPGDRLVGVIGALVIADAATQGGIQQPGPHAAAAGERRQAAVFLQRGSHPPVVCLQVPNEALRLAELDRVRLKGQPIRAQLVSPTRLAHWLADGATLGQATMDPLADLHRFTLRQGGAHIQQQQLLRGAR